MATGDLIGRAYVEIGAEDSKLQAALKRSEDRLRSTAAKMEGLGKSLSRNVTAPLVALGTAGVVAFSKFENQLTAVRTLLDDSSFEGKSATQGFEEMRTAVLALGKDSTSSLGAINKALFDTVSAGVEAGEAVNFLGAANKLAVAGVTDISTATDGLTSAVNAYGIESSKAEAVAAKFFVAQKAGKTTIEELSRSLGRVAPTANSAGVGLNELLAAMSAVTKAGIRTRSAAAGINAALANISKPTADAAEEAERLGVNFSRAGLRAAGGLEPFLRGIREAEGFNQDTFTRLFGSIEASNAINALDAQTETFRDTLGKLQNEAQATGTFLEAFGIQNETSAAKMARLKNELQIVAVELGARLAPAVGSAISLIQKFINGWDGLSDGAKNFVTAAGGIAAVVGPALLVVGKLTKGVAGLIGFTGRLVGGSNAAATAIARFAPTASAASGALARLNAAQAASTTQTGAFSAILTATTGTLGRYAVGIGAATQANRRFATSVIANGQALGVRWVVPVRAGAASVAQLGTASNAAAGSVGRLGTASAASAVSVARLGTASSAASVGVGRLGVASRGAAAAKLAPAMAVNAAAMGTTATAGTGLVGVLGKVGLALGGVSAGAVAIGAIAGPLLLLGAMKGIDAAAQAAADRMEDFRQVATDDFDSTLVNVQRKVRETEALLSKGLYVSDSDLFHVNLLRESLDSLRAGAVTQVVDSNSVNEIARQANDTIDKVEALRAKLAQRNTGAGAFFNGEDKATAQALEEAEQRLEVLRRAHAARRLKDIEDEKQAKIDAEKEAAAAEAKRIATAKKSFNDRLEVIEREKAVKAGEERQAKIDAPKRTAPLDVGAGGVKTFTDSLENAVTSLQNVVVNSDDAAIKEKLAEVRDTLKEEQERVRAEMERGFDKADNAKLETIGSQQKRVLEKIERKIGSGAIFG